MRLLHITLGSALCALALIASPLQAKDKSGDAPAACRCKPDSCKCEKKGVCKCPEASCTCEKCKAVRAKQPAPAAPATKPTSEAPAKVVVNCDDDEDDDDGEDKDLAGGISDLQNHCGKCDKKDGDKPETCPDKAPCCPGKEAPSQLTQDIQNHCGKCDKKDGDKPETCPDKAPCCPGKEDKSA